MQSVFERFLEQLSEGVDEVDFRSALAYLSSQLDLVAFAYLSLPPQGNEPTLISNYPASWTARYLEHQYQSIDPVIVRARGGGCPLLCGSSLPGVEPSEAEHRLFDEAAQFGICCGLTIPIIDLRGNFAAMTFAADKRDASFIRAAERYEHALPYVATCFHMFVRHKLSADRLVNGVLLRAREYECLQWAEKGKSNRDIGCILGITRHTTTFHLPNVRRKLGVSTTRQAVARLVASSSWRY
ncbi:LuxR family transcriptional regulator [Mesorhizobium sp. B283B1A]|uniref:LuxR family transcriptional regulator n=1 Tax=Mesorhizobium TaxID=68287 RepID=UPI001CD0E700|nr:MULTISPECIES: LuxR family transcriptional regulator [Mesorhizobium]MCA0048233.1 LuxR family transcriptional regulator [Mesorhizobium sp. B283B1A]UQS64553.1 LuxR family transcriptional regulator [Mesorhizobium opportunistum]